jgi:membrane protease YdiL (CAAX protease family)
VVTTHPLTAYLVIAYAFSWACWISLALGPRTAEPGVAWPSHMPGLIGPAVAAVIVTACVGGRAGLMELGERLTQWRVGIWWLAVAAILLAGAMGLAIVHGSAVSTLLDRGDLTKYNGIGADWSPLATVGLVFLLNGLGEEIGWRGFLADHLLRHHSLGKASLLVALAWAPWHAPIFFLVGTFRNFTVPQLLGWLIGLAAGSLVLTWLYQGSRRSILLVAVWHTAFNFTSATPAARGMVAALTSTLVMIAALAILVADWRNRRPHRAAHLAIS